MDSAAETFAAVRELVERVAPLLESDNQYRMLVAPEYLDVLAEAGFYDPLRPLAFLAYVKRTSPKPKLRAR